MPLVEILPNTTTSHVTPGWAYVPDPLFASSSSAAAAASASSSTKVGRKRGIRGPGAGGGTGGGGTGGRGTDLTARQQTAILRHLAELDRENHRDVQIPVPVKKGESVSSSKEKERDAARGSRNKTTSNVRRILQSQKTFKNYLDDEESALAQAAQHHPSTATQRTVAGKVTKPTTAARSGTSTLLTSGQNSTPTATISSPTSKRTTKTSRKSLSQPEPQTSDQPSEAKTVPEGASTDQTTSTTANTELEEDQQHPPIQQTLIKTEYDNEPLLKSYLPLAPSQRIMNLLLAEPPLTYNESRASPSTSGYPPRYFCTICGYWGKIKCRSCGTRVCGLDCYKVHEDSRCGAFF